VKRLLALAPVVLLAAAAPGCGLFGALFEKPIVTFKNVDLDTVRYEGIGATFVFTVENPNAIGADLAQLGYQITVDGHAFAAGQSDRALHVPAQGAGELRLPVSIRFAEFAQSLESLVQKQAVPYTLSVQLGFGTPAGVLTVPLSTSGTFPVPRLPRVAFGGLSPGGIDLSGASVRATLQLSNDNPFPIAVGAFRGRLLVGGSPVANVESAPIELPASGTQAVALTARIDAMGMIGGFSSGSTDVSVDGAFDLGGWPWPVRALR
jgi:LEA14-like dessication related protein